MMPQTDNYPHQPHPPSPLEQLTLKHPNKPFYYNTGENRAPVKESDIHH